MSKETNIEKNKIFPNLLFNSVKMYKIIFYVIIFKLNKTLPSTTQAL